MSTNPATHSTPAEPLATENERLRSQVLALQEELVAVQAQANAAVAKWEDRAYWLERWHLDLNELMSRRGASELRATLRGVRWVSRGLRRALRTLRAS